MHPGESQANFLTETTETVFFHNFRLFSIPQNRSYRIGINPLRRQGEQDESGECLFTCAVQAAR